MRSVSDLMRIEDRVAIVTGGAGQIGLAIGEALVEQGARVVVVDLDQTACDERAAILEARGSGEAIGCAADVSLPAQVGLMVDRVRKHWGRIDIVVNNAALTGTSDVPSYAVEFGRQSLRAWDAAMAVNLTATFILVQAARELLDATARGSIINVSSIYGLVGPNLELYAETAMGNPAAYGATKAGLIGLTRYLATVLAPRVRANAIAPGGVARNQPPSFVTRYERMVPMGRMATEEDFKGAIAYLASDASAYVTGQVIPIDGGWTAW